jgi:Protein of unknown function (DUF2637)
MRKAALAAITLLVAAASLTSFAESYRALLDWATRHGLHGGWALAWPLQVDTFIAVGELALFVALADQWTVRSRAAAWSVTLAGLAVSIAGNVGHVQSHDWASQATAAVPPLAAAAALAVGLGVLKRVVAIYPPPGQKAGVKPVNDRTSTALAGRTAKRTGPDKPKRATADIEAAALTALSGQPDMTGPQLAAAIGTTDRTARRIRARLNGASTT